MKELFEAIQKRDGNALSKFAQPERKADQVIDDNTVRLVNQLFEKLKVIFPASVSTILKTPEMEAAARKEWLIALMKGGINSREMLQAGLDKARVSDSDFWPSPGKFIAWCKDGFAERLGLPSVDDVIAVFNRYCRDRGMVGMHGFKWPSPIYFWIVPRVYDQMSHQNLDSEGVRAAAKSEIEKWAARLAKGDAVPEIPVMIAEKPATESARIKRDPAEFCDLSTEGGRRLHAMFMRVRAKRTAQEKK